MSNIIKLNVSAIRNISQLRLEPNANTNLLYGVNGSGKTSILEAIHIAATGKSFRNHKTNPLIQNESDKAMVYVQLESGIEIGLSKTRQKTNELKLQGVRQRSWESVARLLPILVLDSTTFSLLDGGPGIRRRFLDWGVFHVEPSFIGAWRNASKCIAQRNLLLKQQTQSSINSIKAWDTQLAIASIEVDRARQTYFDVYKPLFLEIFGHFCPDIDIGVSYYRGWDSSQQLEQVLAEQRSRDIKYGSTQYGPHRADIRFRQGKALASDTLSRGQQKILVSALKIAQSRMYYQLTGKKSVFLVDDLPSELDVFNRKSVLNALEEHAGQLFVTCVDPHSLDDCWSGRTIVTKFHVEHGTITD